MLRQASTGSRRSTSVASQTTQQSSSVLRRRRGARRTSTLRILTATSSASAAVQEQANNEMHLTSRGSNGGSPLISVSCGPVAMLVLPEFLVALVLLGVAFALAALPILRRPNRE